MNIERVMIRWKEKSDEFLENNFLLEEKEEINKNHVTRESLYGIHVDIVYVKARSHQEKHMAESTGVVELDYKVGRALIQMTGKEVNLSSNPLLEEREEGMTQRKMFPTHLPAG